MTESQSVGDCKHHWILSKLKDGILTGKCKHCKEIKTFKEPSYTYSWESFTIGKRRNANKRKTSGNRRRM
jgi:hypothetical protein